MAMSGPIILHQRSNSELPPAGFPPPAPSSSAAQPPSPSPEPAPPTSTSSGVSGPSGLKPRRTPGDPYRVSRLGIAAGIATALNLVASSVLGTHLSGLIGSNEFTWTSLISLVVTLTSLVAAIVLNVLLSKRGASSARNAMILGLMLLLPPTGVAFYVVNQTLQR
jgi:hypothetical protein